MQYTIQGDNLPVVICRLEQNEQMITERGAMAWMSPNMTMETTNGGGMGKAFGRIFIRQKVRKARSPLQALSPARYGRFR